jgi:hypothetical protein
MSNLDQSQPKMASHLAPTVARHMLVVMPQRTLRVWYMSAMHELVPHLARRMPLCLYDDVECPSHLSTSHTHSLCLSLSHSPCYACEPALSAMDGHLLCRSSQAHSHGASHSSWAPSKPNSLSSPFLLTTGAWPHPPWAAGRAPLPLLMLHFWPSLVPLAPPHAKPAPPATTTSSRSPALVVTGSTLQLAVAAAGS